MFGIAKAVIASKAATVHVSTLKALSQRAGGWSITNVAAFPICSANSNLPKFSGVENSRNVSCSPRASFSQFSTETVHKAVQDLRELPSCLALSDLHCTWAVRSSIQSRRDAGDD